MLMSMFFLFQLKDLQMQLCFTEDNYCRVTDDFNKTQEQLIKITKQEADLQECLTNIVLIIFMFYLTDLIFLFSCLF